MVEPIDDPMGGPPMDPPTPNEVVINSVDSDMMNTVFVWLLFVVLLFTIGRYSGQITGCFRKYVLG